MSEPQLPREMKRRLAISRHAEEVTGNVALTCRYYGIYLRQHYHFGRPRSRCTSRATTTSSSAPPG